MDYFSGHIQELIEQLATLPGIGSKTAQRLAFHIISMPKEKVEKLSKTLTETRQKCATARNARH
jgi:recombination protein RecR